MSNPIPPEIEEDLARATRLAWWTLGWMTSVVVLMGFAMGSSQAMRTAWIEDLLSLIPAIVFLVALHFERKGPTRLFPHGFHRVNSLAFMAAAVALAGMGALLLFEALSTLAMHEHVTIPPVSLFGEDVWMGWVMIAALAYSVIPPVVLGRMKLPLARRLQDKVLHTDAMMQKADWMTGLAGIAGVLGLGLGLWWADAAAAGVISASILHDGVRALRSSVGELGDGAPRALDRPDMAPDAKRLRAALRKRFPGCEVRLRESGRFILAQVWGQKAPSSIDLKEIWPGDPERSWRFAQLSFVPPEKGESS